jgi:Carboxypeptidase regulatory-like domain
MSRSQDRTTTSKSPALHLSPLSMRSWSLLLLPLLTLASVAQNNSTRPATGTVTGHVYCADTNAPARMASVQLEPVSHAEKQSGPQSFDKAPPGGVVQTALDGSFMIPNVAPGSYYIVAIAAGYLSSWAKDDEIDEAAPQPSAGQPPLVVPKVDVTADQAANIDIRLERGAAVSGTVRYDDGSPASGVTLAVLRKRNGKWVPSPAAAFIFHGPLMTDDLGRYRIGGLRDRQYVVQAVLIETDLVSASPGAPGLFGMLRNALTVYSGDTMRRSYAVPFKLSAGEERTGEDITIPLSKLHSLSGVVIAAGDSHAINAGDVEIVDPDEDDSLAQTDIDRDGGFRLEGVPEGSYKLRVRHARDTRSEEFRVPGQNVSAREEKTIHQYGDLEQPIKVEGDILNLTLSVPEQKKDHAAASQ